jgi:D-sedoheptulose 7-phosphate isomerase
MEEEKEIERELSESIRVKESLTTLIPDIKKVAEAISECYMNGKKVILFGNGGSAADAQHIACELVGKFKRERRALEAIALTTNTSILTAIANDYDFSRIFERQIEALAQKGDVVIGISTSGKSENVIRGVEKAREIGAKTIGLTGKDGGKLKDVAELSIRVPSDNTPRIQEAHITIGHIICYLVEKNVQA